MTSCSRVMLSKARARERFLCALITAGLVWVLPASFARAGSVSFAWSSVSDPDVAGYRLFYGTSSATYTSTIDVGNVTAYAVTGLADCSRFYFALKAYDRSGNLSALSNEVSGQASPALSTVVPGGAERGQTLSVAVTGANFSPGAVLRFSDPRITVGSTTVQSCAQASASISIPLDAPVGATDVELVNPDGSHGRRISGFQVTQSVAPLQVLSAAPPAGEAGADPGTAVEIRFSARLDAASVNRTSFSIQRQGMGTGLELALAPPALDAEGKTVLIRPAALLEAGQRYDVIVRGGRAGVRSTDGSVLAADYRSRPFGTAKIEQAIVYGSRDDIASGVWRRLVAGTEVPVSAVFAVRFFEPLDTASVNNTTVEIVGSGEKIPLAGGAPRLSMDGLTVMLEAADLLAGGESLQLTIKGGPKGIRSARGVRLGEPFISVRFATVLDSVGSFGVAE